MTSVNILSASPASNCSAVIGTLGILETSLTTIFSRLISQSWAGVRTRVGHGRLTLGPRPSDRSLIIGCQPRPRHSLQRRETGGGRNLDHGSVWAAACVWVIAAVWEFHDPRPNIVTESDHWHCLARVEYLGHHG